MNSDVKKFNELILKYTNFFKKRPDFKEWRERRINQENYQEHVIKNLKNFFPNLKKLKILEVGSGMGGFLVAMKKQKFDIEGLEFNSDYCVLTNLRAKKNNVKVKLKNEAMEENSFKKNYFDLIYCNDVLEHSIDPKKCLNEFNRILKKNGKVYITIINRFAFKDPHYYMYFVNWLPRKIGNVLVDLFGIDKSGYSGIDNQKLSDMHYYTYNEFLKLAEKKGFNVRDVMKEKILSPEKINSEQKKKIIKFLNNLRISEVIYAIHSNLFAQSFCFILEKKK